MTDDLATWMRALVGGEVLDADFRKRWPESPEVPGEASTRKHGYGILTLRRGPNTIYYH